MRHLFVGIRILARRHAGFAAVMLSTALMTSAALAAAIGPPNTIVVDTLPYRAQYGYKDINYHPGQRVIFRVRYYDAKGKLQNCDGFQVDKINPQVGGGDVINMAIGAKPPNGPFAGQEILDVVMGNQQGVASLVVHCGNLTKRVLV